MSETYIDDKIESLVEQCISLGENAGEMPSSSISSYRAEVREVERFVTKIKNYISGLEDESSDACIRHLLKTVGLDE